MQRVAQATGAAVQTTVNGLDQRSLGTCHHFEEVQARNESAQLSGKAADWNQMHILNHMHDRNPECCGTVSWSASGNWHFDGAPPRSACCLLRLA